MSADPVNYVLIDYENVQPKDLDRLKPASFRLKVFVGPNQKVRNDVNAAIKQLGRRADEVRLKAAGRNALDFHIAYYVGELSGEHAAAGFHIISKDKGFDPLIMHLVARKVSIERRERIADMSCIKPAFPPTIAEQVRAVVNDLRPRKSSRPSTLEALSRDIYARFNKEPSEDQLSKLIDHLCAQGIVKEDGKKLSYKLPTLPA